jgi:transcription elongation factor Elf1
VAERPGHFQCPFCNSFDVNRLFVATLNLDSCECCSCGARWDEEAGSGKYRGRSNKTSVLVRRPKR